MPMVKYKKTLLREKKNKLTCNDKMSQKMNFLFEYVYMIVLLYIVVVYGLNIHA